MYKIMLADDEGIVIDSLKFIIEKEFGDICAVEYAKTGRSVIELAESFRPDIAIMDIQMPGINGIDAMKEIRQTNTNTVFIVMSAYDKFDYAKEAIKLGVLEYITKPMEKTKIVAALQKAMEMIDREKEKRSNELLVKEKLETVVPIIESGLIYNILLQEHFVEDIENYKSILGINQKYAYMIAVVCGDEQDGNHMTNAVGSGVKMQKHYQEVRESLKECFHGIVGTVLANKLAVLVPYERDTMDYNERIELIEKARELTRRMRKRIDISFRIGIGGAKEFHDMSESYSEALNALVATTGSVAHVDDLPIRCEYAGDYPIKLEKKLFAEIEDGEMNNAVASARSFFEWMEESHSNLMDIRLKILEFALWAEHIAYEKGGMTYQLNSRADYLPQIMEMSDLTQLRKWFVDKVMQACQNILSKRTEKSNSIIGLAKDYIRSNYNRDISLDDVSRAVNISPYYFSKIFKENTGENFIEYLTNIRIDKAKELLGTTEYSMKEICSMVGYSDPNYFSRSFKKNVGVTPTEYKEGRGK
ncbi:MAG: response regulator [Bacillota bacterium]|nr:response regulator [Bacillota bacterium]